jgi:hypothetical protein
MPRVKATAPKSAAKSKAKNKRKAEESPPVELEKIEVFKLTQEHWYPSYILDWHAGVKNPKLVIVKFIQFPKFGGWRISVRGDEGPGLEYNVGNVLRQVAFDLFLKVIREKYIRKEWLIQHGFVQT